MTRCALSLLLSVVLIFSFGLLMVFNTSAAAVLDRSLGHSTHHALLRQIFYGALGAGAGWGVWKVGYERILQHSGTLLMVGTCLLICVFIPGLSQEIKGSHRWVSVFGLSFQPSEFMKFLIPLYYIHVITVQEKPLILKSLLKLLGLIAIPIALILIEPDNGSVAIILASLLALFVLTRLKWVYWVLPLCVLTALGVVAASQMKHVPDRIRVYLHPELDLQGKGHQPYQAKIAAGCGRLWGKGFGESVQKLDYLPEAKNDYIAAIFAEECGFMGMLGLIGLYMGIGYLGFHLCSRTETLPCFYLAALLTFLISFQAFLNLGVVSGLLPSKGTNLPFFSQGGSSLLANSMAVALLLNVAKPKERYAS